MANQMVELSTKKILAQAQQAMQAQANQSNRHIIALLN
jgi:hypothetical protein